MKRFVILLAACGDALDQRLAIIEDTRLLAVVADPAEAKPNATQTYSALVASPTGPVADPPAWAYCLAPKPPTEDNVVVPGCLVDDMIAPLGVGASVTGTLPKDGCLLFGPDTPPGGFRPRDPDETGGFYQPVRVTLGDAIGFGLARITCNLNAPQAVAHDYLLNYHANQNPTLLPFALADVAANSDVTLTASWPPEAAESYLWFDPDEQDLVTRHEGMRVSWYATGGSLPVDASAVDEDDTTTSVSTTWHAPGPGTVFLWFVLRDSRGGIATQQLEVTVR